MVYKESNIELWINDQLADITSAESLNLRLNNVVSDPTTLSTTRAEYSFSFNLPATPTNNKIFDHANNLSKNNKFISQYTARVYANGSLLFNGSLTLNSISQKDGYNVNLVAIRALDLDEIFGDAKMNELEWYIPFDGVATINDINAELDTDVVFPLVSYGPFQKVPTSEDEVGKTYTSKYDFDKYNRWYVESFYPSLKMITTLKKCFEHKGYNVDGDALYDYFLNKIYCSVNLADEQDPTYNLGNDNFGKVSMQVVATTNSSNIAAYEQELEFPYFRVLNPRGQFGGSMGPSGTYQEYNFKSVYLYDLLSIGNVTMNQSVCYMYQPNEHIIVIPASGFYKFEVEVQGITQTNATYDVKQYVLNSQGNDIVETGVTINQDLREATPFELHIVRNYDDDIELIKGKYNKQYVNGNPTQSTYNGKSNIVEWQTCYPHEDPYNSNLPTEKNGLTLRNTRSSFGGASTNNPNTGGGSTEGGSRSGSDEGTTGRGGFGGRRTPSTTPRNYTSKMLGYVPKNNNTDIMAYDPAVNPNFICGFSTFMGGSVAALKNGRSWSPNKADINYSFYKQPGYDKLYTENGSILTASTEFNENQYLDAPTSSFSSGKNSANGKVECMVYLNKNDVIQLYGVQRAYTDMSGRTIQYSTTVNFNFTMTAASPKKYEILKAGNYGYNSESDFDYQLRLGNFLNREKEMKEWVDGVIKAFNLDVKQDGKNVTINIKDKVGVNNAGIIDLDTKCNSADAIIKRIDYPKNMSVRYSIDEEEFGFEQSVPKDKINEDDWAEYGDRGYSVIDISDMEGAKEDAIELPFSYTWYFNFNWYNVNSDFQQLDNPPVILRIPVISKSEYMISGYDYSESLKHDGYGLAQRFWIRPSESNQMVYTRTYPVQYVRLYIPSNIFTNYRDVYFNLSYKDTERSILTEYFDIKKNVASNYVEIDAYLTAEEYKLLKSGGLVRFDSDLYYIASIDGFDPTQSNTTKLTLVKK